MKTFLIKLLLISLIKLITSQSITKNTVEQSFNDLVSNEEPEIEAEEAVYEESFPNYKSEKYQNSFNFKPLIQTKSQQFKRYSTSDHTYLNDSNNTDYFINKTQDGTNTTKMLNLLPPMANNNETNELEDLKMILNQIYEQLETIKTEKMCTDKDPDGNDCDINGTWNSAEIGLRIELSASPPNVDGNKLVVNLAEKNPKKPTYRIDTTWICSGYKVQKNGGPFYFHCTNHQSPQSMTIFHGICKRCGGFDTIFGEWIFQHIPSDCRQLWTFSETKRDVFHKNILHNLKFSNIDNVANNQTSLYSLNKNNETINFKTAKSQQSMRNYIHRVNQDLFGERFN